MNFCSDFRSISSLQLKLFSSNYYYYLWFMVNGEIGESFKAVNWIIVSLNSTLFSRRGWKWKKNCSRLKLLDYMLGMKKKCRSKVIHIFRMGTNKFFLFFFHLSQTMNYIRAQWLISVEAIQLSIVNHFKRNNMTV